jgi:hypothetical protein
MIGGIKAPVQISNLVPGLKPAKDSSGADFEFTQAMVPASAFKTGFQYSVYSGRNTTTIDQLYSIAIMNTTASGWKKVWSIPGLDPHAAEGDTGNDKAEHFFTMPPKSVDMTEPFATRIIPTQNGGRYIESHGSLIREIRIQGNSGLRPNKPVPLSVDLLGSLGPLAGPANAIAGPIINRADRLVDTATGLADDVLNAFGLGESKRKLDPTERTGYDDIMKLRNIFRAYSDIKNRGGVGASQLLMVWRNVKDADYWVVEPVSFQLVQDSKSPLTYNYVITLKTITRYDYTFKPPKDPYDQIRASQNLISGIQTASREVTNTLFVVSTQIDRLAGAGVSAQNLIMEPAIAAVNGATAITNSAQGFTDTFRNNWARLRDNLDEAVSILQSKFNNNVPSTLGSSPVSGSLSQTEQEELDSFAGITNALRAASRASNRVLASVHINSVSNKASSRKNNMTKAYRKPGLGTGRQGTAPTTGGDASYLGNNSLPEGMSRAVVGYNDSIFSLAQRLLGNRNKWKLLVIVNDLRAPYISRNGDVQTLAPGDYILYPVEGGGVSAQATQATDLQKDQSGLNVDTEIEGAYGRDLRLKSNADNMTDFVVKDGDVATIYGVPNVKQAVRLKFATELGTLTVHPYYGAAIPIGSKMTAISMNEFRINTLATLKSDPRISEVTRLDFFMRGDVVSVGAKMVLIDQADSTAVAFNAGSL